MHDQKSVTAQARGPAFRPHEPTSPGGPTATHGRMIPRRAHFSGAGMRHLREETLSAPNCTMMIGDPVICRRGPLDHEFRGRVVGRTIGRHVYDVETADGERLSGITIIRLDEEAMAIARKAEGIR